jgi:hypothetical protein
MPYPDQVAYAQSEPKTTLDPTTNPLGRPDANNEAFIGNAHTYRATDDSAGAVTAGGEPLPIGPGGSPATQTFVQFDGSSYLTNAALSAGADSAVGAMVAWLEPVTGAVVECAISIGDGTAGVGNLVCQLRRQTSGTLQAEVVNQGTTTRLYDRTPNDTFPLTAVCVMVSWDTTNQLQSYYYNNAPASGGDATVGVGTLDWSGRDVARIGIRHDTADIQIWTGRMSDIWVTKSEYIDFSDAGERLRFINADDSWKPINTGSPVIQFGRGQTAADWNAGTNLGSGGNFVMTGAVT